MHNNESHLTVLSSTRPLHTQFSSVCSKQVASQVRQEEIGMCSGTINLDCGGKADGSAASLSPAIHNCSGTKVLGLPGHRHQGGCARSRLGLTILSFAFTCSVAPSIVLLVDSTLDFSAKLRISCPTTHRPAINVIFDCAASCITDTRFDLSAATGNLHGWKLSGEHCKRHPLGRFTAIRLRAKSHAHSRRIYGTRRARLPSTA